MCRYCSGDVHRGQRVTASPATFGLYFSGHLNVARIMDVRRSFCDCCCVTTCMMLASIENQMNLSMICQTWFHAFGDQSCDHQLKPIYNSLTNFHSFETARVIINSKPASIYSFQQSVKPICIHLTTCHSSSSFSIRMELATQHVCS